MDGYVVYCERYGGGIASPPTREQIGTFLSKDTAYAFFNNCVKDKKPCSKNDESTLYGYPAQYILYQVREVVTYGGRKQTEEVMVDCSDIVYERSMKQGISKNAKDIIVGLGIMVIVFPLLLAVLKSKNGIGILNVIFLVAVILFFSIIAIKDKLKK